MEDALLLDIVMIISEELEDELSMKIETDESEDEEAGTHWAQGGISSSSQMRPKPAQTVSPLGSYGPVQRSPGQAKGEELEEEEEEEKLKEEEELVIDELLPEQLDPPLEVTPQLQADHTELG